jgi:hypothetical protein
VLLILPVFFSIFIAATEVTFSLDYLLSAFSDPSDTATNLSDPISIGWPDRK